MTTSAGTRSGGKLGSGADIVGDVAPSASEVVARVLLSAIDKIGAGVVVLTRDQKVLHSSSRARAIFADGDPLILTGDHLGVTASERQKFDDFLATLHQSAEGSGCILARSGEPHIFVAASKRSPGERLFDPRLVWITPLSGAPDCGPIAHAYGLTRGEQRVLTLLANGQSVTEVSALLDVSVATVRTHVQRMLGKTGARSQANLLRLAYLAPGLNDGLSAEFNS